MGSVMRVAGYNNVTGVPQAPYWPSQLQLSAQLPTHPSQMIAPLVKAAGALCVGLLLHRLPTRALPGKQWLPSDWKAWGRVALGLVATHQINNAFGLKLPPWLSAIETVSVVHPLASQFSKNTPKQLLVIAPVVAALVQLSHWGYQSTTGFLKAHEINAPAWLPKLLFAAVTTTVGLVAFPKLYQPFIKRGWFGKPNSKAFQSATMSMMTCPRGCTVGGVICLSEAGEILGSLATSVGLKKTED